VLFRSPQNPKTPKKRKTYIIFYEKSYNNIFIIINKIKNTMITLFLDSDETKSFELKNLKDIKDLEDLFNVCKQKFKLDERS
jgi:hypothetical protein